MNLLLCPIEFITNNQLLFAKNDQDMLLFNTSQLILGQQIVDVPLYQTLNLFNSPYYQQKHVIFDIMFQNQFSDQQSQEFFNHYGKLCDITLNNYNSIDQILQDVIFLPYLDLDSQTFPFHRVLCFKYLDQKFKRFNIPGYKDFGIVLINQQEGAVPQDLQSVFIFYQKYNGEKVFLDLFQEDVEVHSDIILMMFKAFSMLETLFGISDYQDLILNFLREYLIRERILKGPANNDLRFYIKLNSLQDLNAQSESLNSSDNQSLNDQEIPLEEMNQLSLGDTYISQSDEMSIEFQI